MAATVVWAQTHGTSPGTAVDLGASGNLFNFKAADDATVGNYASFPVVASDAVDAGNSYEVFLRLHATGTFNRIENVQFWQSTAFSPATGLSIFWKGNNQTAYATPVQTDSPRATVSVPTSDPGTANVSIAGSLSGALTAAGYTDYIVLQFNAASTAAPGDTSLAVFTAQYDES